MAIPETVTVLPSPTAAVSNVAEVWLTETVSPVTRSSARTTVAAVVPSEILSTAVAVTTSVRVVMVAIVALVALTS